MRVLQPLALALGLMTVANCDTLIAPPEERSGEPSLVRIQGPAGGLFVDDGGRGNAVPVVFVHSFGGSSGHWSTQLAHLRLTRRAIAFDLRGHGQSAAPRGDDYSVAAFGQDIAAVVDGLNLERFVLVGHSLGGAAATAYVGEHPEAVAGLVLVGTPGKAPPEMSAKIMASMEAEYGKVSQQYWHRLLAGAQSHVRSRILSEMMSVPKDASLSIIRGVFEHDPLPSLTAYSGPKLIISGAAEDQAGSLHQQAPEIPHRTISGTSHWMQMDKPAEFNAILDGFLAEVDRQATM
jgi:pimeloyl-ACP methyl ester carboxylesterase